MANPVTCTPGCFYPNFYVDRQGVVSKKGFMPQLVDTPVIFILDFSELSAGMEAYDGEWHQVFAYLISTVHRNVKVCF